MVQSIWLNFDLNQRNDETISKIIEIVKDNYKCYSYISPDTYKAGVHDLNVRCFIFLDTVQIKEVLNKIGLLVNDKKRCNCGCYSTDFETMMYFINLELTYGSISDVEYFRLGRDVWGSVGLFKERLNVLRYILENLQKSFNKEGIKSDLCLDDCEEKHFKNYKGVI